MDAAAYRLEGATSASFASIDLRKFSAVSFNPSCAASNLRHQVIGSTDRLAGK